MDAIETPHCLGRLEVWVPKLDHLATWQDAYEDAQRQGNELWLYTVGIFQGGSLPNKTVDVPLIESRMLHWLNYRYGLKGYLHWGCNAWTEDPLDGSGRTPRRRLARVSEAGGLLNSLRWEQMRNGIQDYECLWLLENKIAQIKATAQPARRRTDPARRGAEWRSRRKWSRPTPTSRATPRCCMRPGGKRSKRRVDLDASPRMILQTNPPEHSIVANNCAVSTSTAGPSREQRSRSTAERCPSRPTVWCWKGRRHPGREPWWSRPRTAKAARPRSASSGCSLSRPRRNETPVTRERR